MKKNLSWRGRFLFPSALKQLIFHRSDRASFKWSPAPAASVPTHVALQFRSRGRFLESVNIDRTYEFNYYPRTITFNVSWFLVGADGGVLTVNTDKVALCADVHDMGQLRWYKSHNMDHFFLHHETLKPNVTSGSLVNNLDLPSIIALRKLSDSTSKFNRYIFVNKNKIAIWESPNNTSNFNRYWVAHENRIAT